MDTLQKMRVFARVAETGSFTAAAHSMNMTTGVMSRALSELERHLKARLMHRSTRRLALTPVGEHYLQRCLKILADVDLAEEEASGAHVRPTGQLKMHTFASIGQHYVLPAFTEYQRQYPDVSIDIALLQRMPDLFDGSSEMAVVTAMALPDSELVSHLLGSTFSILCASPGYLGARGAPALPQDLLDHDCLLLRTPAFPTYVWQLEGPRGTVQIDVSGRVQTNTAESLAVSIRHGLGIGMLPLYAAIDDLSRGTLVRVLPEYTLQKMNIYALYPSRHFVDARVRTWVEFLRVHMPEAVRRDEALLDRLAGERVTDLVTEEPDEAGTLSAVVS
ncbi:LysR family transcriptional regulator [Burkholderia sp. WAC0059]|uniref:LysR family transcriptional regulator n=1 Tax=Burkholderia sp. WAC0059 TaxID=2066022 RepID=UPI000C7EC5D0|nr:LysR family transcriptional regulator [Burkholderia sp. WAC0059]PLZ03147.1 LysR family transcriptional regulator [Burkholderia sp. WAC0059]